MKTYSCPEWVVALLRDIDREMERVHWNVFQKEMDSPFENTGSRYMGKSLKVKAYSWGDDDPIEWNFKFGDIEVSWYKHLGRGTRINIDPKSKHFKEMMLEMYNTCIEEVREADIEI